MSAYTATLRARAAAEALMIDTVMVTRQTGATTDTDTGVVTPIYSTVYTGKCKVQQSSPASGTTEVGEAAVFLNQLQLHLPVTTTTALVAPDDIGTLTTCVLDAGLVGKAFHLRAPLHKSFATARRFPMVEVVG
jgi:hypothetical protein